MDKVSIVLNAARKWAIKQGDEGFTTTETVIMGAVNEVATHNGYEWNEKEKGFVRVR